MSKNKKTTSPRRAEAPHRATTIISNNTTTPAALGVTQQPPLIIRNGPAGVISALRRLPEFGHLLRICDKPVLIDPDGYVTKLTPSLLLSRLNVEGDKLAVASVAAKAMLDDTGNWHSVASIQSLPIFSSSGEFAGAGFDPASQTFVTGDAPTWRVPSAKEEAQAVATLRAHFGPSCTSEPAFACLVASLVSVVVRACLGPDTPRPPVRLHGAVLDTERLAQALALVATGRVQPAVRDRGAQDRAGVAHAGVQKTFRQQTRRRQAVAHLAGCDYRALQALMGGLAYGRPDLVSDMYAEEGRQVEPPALLVASDFGSSAAPDVPTILVGETSDEFVEAVRTHLTEIRIAICDLVYRWHRLGAKPAKTASFSHFSSWSRLVGGILKANGVEHFEPTVSVTRVSGADPEFEALMRLLSTRFGEKPFLAGQALTALDSDGLVVASCLGSSREQRARQLGNLLASHEGEAVDGWTLNVSQHRHHQNEYRLAKLGTKTAKVADQ